MSKIKNRKVLYIGISIVILVIIIIVISSGILGKGIGSSKAKEMMLLIS